MQELPSIILQNQVPRGMKKSEALMQMEATIKKYTSEVHLTEEDLYDADKKQPPRFVTQILDQNSLVEMQTTKFECQLAPVGDPNMKVEWFFNGKPLPHKNRFTPIYDFGYVAMNFGWVYPEDSGEYLCRATNLYGMDETRAVIKTAGKPGIIYDSQLPKGMKSIERIREMEAAWQLAPEQPGDEMKPKLAPTFVTKPEPFTVTEGESARFCCRVTGHPKPRVMWVVNGHTVVNYDHGKVEVVARNSAGEAIAETVLTVKAREDDYRNVLKNSPRRKFIDVFQRLCETDESTNCVFLFLGYVIEDPSTPPLSSLTASLTGGGHCKRPARPLRSGGIIKVTSTSLFDFMPAFRERSAWYDYELTQYQKERQETELEKVFEERSTLLQEHVDIDDAVKQKIIREPETEWQQAVRSKKGEDYYTKLKEFAIPGEKIVASSVAKGMAQSYEQKLDTNEQQPLTGSPQVPRRTTEFVIDSQTIQSLPPEPSESSIHGREVHVAKQKQTQKEVKGDLEITRKITATETTEVEHKAKTQERVVQGQVVSEVYLHDNLFHVGLNLPYHQCSPRRYSHVAPSSRNRRSLKWSLMETHCPKYSGTAKTSPLRYSPDLQVHTFSTKSILIMRQVFMEDSGVFSVIAENRGGRAKCSANLVVEEKRKQGRGGVVPPSFLTTVQSTTVPAGQLARFDARLSGTKPIDVYWLKNGKKVTPDIRHKTLEEDNTYTLLIIETLPEDSGKYECVAINSAGEARCDCECTVQSPSVGKQPSKPSTPGAEKAPGIVEPLKGQTIKEGQAVDFRCKISGKPASNNPRLQNSSSPHPLVCDVSTSSRGKNVSTVIIVLFTAPTIKWQKGDKVIKPSKYFQMLKDGDVYTLRISEAFPEDEGIYKCVASNPIGSVTLSGELKVLAPETQEVAPTLNPLRDVIVQEGSPAQFRTQATGKPRPTIQWLREGAVIPQSADFQVCTCFYYTL
ncbi:unnamed protein product [Timema podura]|uniref:Ig-like domain-containing protein n=1 Tax=Timema podura TaxID=61482 RepID=A0ABN7NIH0_TIMPD|nr:unnamed protein product [Timema podura]